jgi:hypothetical protein
MNIRLVTLATLASVPAILSAECAAASDRASLDACAKVFAAGLATHGMPADKFRISFMGRGYVETAAQYEAGIYTYTVTARDSQSGAVMATANCNVDADGAVTALSYLGFQAPALAAR